MKILVPAILLMLWPTIRLTAQWVPVSGRIVTKTEVVAADGTVSDHWKTTSLYARSSTGSILIQRLGRSGKPVSATLLDYGKSMKTYSLTYHGGQVNDMHQPLDRQFAAPPPTGMSAAHKSISQGNDKVDGVDCFIVPMYDTGPNRTRVLVGKAWLAPSFNNLIMREEFVRARTDGGRRRIVREMKITNQAEPSGELFSIDTKTVAGLWKVAPSQQ